MNEEGIIKFNCDWIKEAAPPEDWIKELNAWRDSLYNEGLIGMDRNKIGFGNISARVRQGLFVITGSGTGKYKNLTGEHYTQVTAYDIDKNSLTARGPVIASSESLTHAMIYECASGIHAVMHVHHPGLWRMLLDNFPFTRENIAYGTTEMAREISRLFKETTVQEQKIFAMKGHEAGIVSFGENLNEAGKSLFEQLRKL
jgi:L-ribulose-5-phosphate 4-epimerase